MLLLRGTPGPEGHSEEMLSMMDLPHRTRTYNHVGSHDKCIRLRILPAQIERHTASSSSSVFNLHTQPTLFKSSETFRH